MIESFFKSQADWSALILRITAGLIMLPHGLQKLIGWFGGYGFSGTMNYFTSTMKIPWLIAFLVIVIESLGSVLLLVGAGTRIFAFLLMTVMIAAIITINWRNGLFMNWNGSQSGEGFEYHLLFIGICLSIILIGGGKYSIDTLLW